MIQVLPHDILHGCLSSSWMVNKVNCQPWLQSLTWRKSRESNLSPPQTMGDRSQTCLVTTWANLWLENATESSTSWVLLTPFILPLFNWMLLIHPHLQTSATASKATLCRARTFSLQRSNNLQAFFTRHTSFYLQYFSSCWTCKHVIIAGWLLSNKPIYRSRNAEFCGENSDNYLEINLIVLI